MTEPLAISTPEPSALLAVELWEPHGEAQLAEDLGVAPPGPGRSSALDGGWRAIRVEPEAWWLSGPPDGLAAIAARVEQALNGAGAAVDLSGGFAAVRIEGAGWRELLMIGGVFDAEDPAFGEGCTAGTVLHHVAVRYDVIAPGAVIAYAPPSYLEDLLHHWRAAAARRR